MMPDVDLGRTVKPPCPAIALFEFMADGRVLTPPPDRFCRKNVIQQDAAAQNTACG
jgi:hypothetical protein